MFAYVGCRTTEKRKARGKGIRVFSVDETNGDWKEIQTLNTMENPSYQCTDQNERYLYSVHGDFNQVSAYCILPDYTLRFLNMIDLPGGRNPVFITVDSTNRFCIAATLQGGRVFVIRRNEDGSLGEIVFTYFVEGKEISTNSYLHQCMFDQTGKWLFVVSQGRDTGYGQLRVLRFDSESGSLALADEYRARAGAEPRHLVVHPSNRYLYMINEKDNRMIYFGFDPETGKIEGRQMLPTLPENYTGEADSGASVICKSGKFVMGSNRIHETVALFRADDRTGYLTRLENYPTLGKTPRFMGIAPGTDLLYVANETTDNITEFRLNESNQRLEYTGRMICTESPVCITFVKERKE